MLLNAALGVLAVWYDIGELVHILLLVGLMVLLLGALKARDAAAQRTPQSEKPQ